MYDSFEILFVREVLVCIARSRVLVLPLFLPYWSESFRTNLSVTKTEPPRLFSPAVSVIMQCFEKILRTHSEKLDDTVPLHGISVHGRDNHGRAQSLRIMERVGRRHPTDSHESLGSRLIAYPFHDSRGFLFLPLFL